MAHLDLRDELRKYFADASKLEAIARSLKTASFGSGDSEASPSLGKIRYFGDYELLGEIARSGMGVVFRASRWQAIGLRPNPLIVWRAR